MKNKILMSLMALVCAFIVSCSDDEGDIKFLSDDNSNVYTIMCPAAESWQHFIVNSTADWTVETDDPWIHLAKKSYLAKETTGMFKVSLFSGYTSRTGSIRVKAGNKTIVITVIQMGSPVVSFNQKNYQFTNKRTSFVADINTNASLVANIEYVEREGSEEKIITPEESWLSYTLQESGTENKQQLVLTAQANESELSRYARVIVKDVQSVTTDTIRIEQLETDVFRVVDGDDPSTASYVLSSYKEGTVKFYIDNNVSYTETFSADWITKNTTKFAREELNYNVAESKEFDTREGTITLVHGNEKIVLTIQQQYWTNFADFSITSNTPWIPQESLKDDKDGGAIFFQVEKNNGEKRSGSITVTCVGDNDYYKTLNKTLNVVQNQFEARTDLNYPKRTMFLDPDGKYNYEPLKIGNPNFEYVSIVWKSSDENRATVEANGKINTIAVTSKDNPVTITATITLNPDYHYSGEQILTTTCALTVANAELSDKEVNLTVGGADKEISLTTDNFTPKSVEWSSEDENIATAVSSENNKCTITAVGEGETKVKAKITTGFEEVPEIILECDVTVTTPPND